jgi:hypothetical protein
MGSQASIQKLFDRAAAAAMVSAPAPAPVR